MILERGEGREKERERNIDMREKRGSVAFHMHHYRRPNPESRGPDQKSNPRPFDL